MESLKNFEGLSIPHFDEVAGEENLYTHKNPSTLQVNMGNLCNLACKHCHVNASPKGENIIREDVKEAVIRALDKFPFKVLDITGGAPEMMPGFKDFVRESKNHVDKVMVRTNLCILEEDGYKDLPEFFKKNKIHLVASLPSTKEKITDRQRGRGVYEKSIKALQSLSSLGYGKDEDLVLDLVFNPNGAVLPPDEKSMEETYKDKLMADYGITFNKLLTITNNPLGRFGDFLKKNDLMEDYMDALYSAYNPGTLDSIMCKDMISLGWDGRIYDCDFNQAAGLEVNGPVKTIFDVLEKGLDSRRLATDYHCYGCTAGAGSSCGGSLE